MSDRGDTTEEWGWSGTSMRGFPKLAVLLGIGALVSIGAALLFWLIVTSGVAYAWPEQWLGVDPIVAPTMPLFRVRNSLKIAPVARVRVGREYGKGLVC